jgi:hypothetical protein
VSVLSRVGIRRIGDQPAYPRPYDLLIVDEAHNVAPSGRGKYAIDSQRTAAIRTLAPFFEHKLFEGELTDGVWSGHELSIPNRQGDRDCL